MCTENTPAPRIENHLALAIITTLLCCLPLGLVSLFYAARVDGLVFAGMTEEAAEASKKAKFWGFAALAASGVIFAITFLIAIILAAAAVFGSMTPVELVPVQ